MHTHFPDPDIDQLVATIVRYAAIESPSGDTDALSEMAAALTDDASAAGLVVSAEPSPAGDHLVWTLPAQGGVRGRLLFLSHYDTVWPIGTHEHMPTTVTGDRLSGPGVYDTKAGIAVLLDALARVRRAEVPHPEIRIVVVADEEVGSPTATTLIQREAEQADAVLGLEPPHPGGDLKTGRRGSTRARIRVEGVEAHAALDPDSGVNAIDELIDQIRIVKDAAAPRPVLLNLGTIAGGGRTNVVAGSAQADLGLRFQASDDEEAVLGAIHALTPLREGAHVHTSLLSHRPTWTEGAQTRALSERCSQIAASIGQSLGGSPADGAADTNTTGALGRPTVDGLAPHGGGAHATHEWVSISGIRDRAQLLPALITGLLPA